MQFASLWECINLITTRNRVWKCSGDISVQKSNFICMHCWFSQQDQSQSSLICTLRADLLQFKGQGIVAEWFVCNMVWCRSFSQMETTMLGFIFHNPPKHCKWSVCLGLFQCLVTMLRYVSSKVCFLSKKCMQFVTLQWVLYLLGKPGDYSDCKLY